MLFNSSSREFAANVALFLDVDGTLLEFADSPKRSFPMRTNRHPLGLEVTLGGAIALISGRTIEELIRYLTQLGCRLGTTWVRRRDAKEPVALGRPRMRWKVFGLPKGICQSNHGSLLEDKGATLALHYRGAIVAVAAENNRQLIVDRNDCITSPNMVFESSLVLSIGVAIARF